MGVRPGKSTKTNQDDCLSTLHTCGHMISLLVHSQACIWNTTVLHGSPHHTLLHSVVIGFVAVGQSYFQSLGCVSDCEDSVQLYSWSCYRTSCTRVDTSGPLFCLVTLYPLTKASITITILWSLVPEEPSIWAIMFFSNTADLTAATVG